MERPLTVRQRRFAVGVVSGLGKTAAHAAAYQNNMKRSTRETAAKQTAKIPKVKAEIERLTLELLPPVEDLRAVYQHSLSVIVKLTLESPDERLRFDAARWLRAECERQEQLIAESRPEPETERMLGALRALYARVEGGAGAPALTPLEIAEGAADGDGPPAEQPAPAALVDTSEVTAAAEDSERPDERSAAEELCVQPVFRRVAVPGHFPPRFKSGGGN